jgi:hypothetical protein
MLVDGAALLAEVDAGAIRTLPEHQLTIAVPLGKEVRQVSAITLLVYRNARVVAASSALAARNRPCLAAPPSVEEVLSSVAD